MAKTKKKITKKSTSTEQDATVIRISASDKKEKKPATKTINRKKTATTEPARQAAPKKRGAVRAFFGYFKGAWQELKLVRWPTRKATWGLTLAVLLFSAFFVVFILLIDAGFKYMFELLYKK